jgi:hypothetical protein
MSNEKDKGKKLSYDEFIKGRKIVERKPRGRYSPKRNYDELDRHYYQQYTPTPKKEETVAPKKLRDIVEAKKPLDPESLGNLHLSHEGHVNGWRLHHTDPSNFLGWYATKKGGRQVMRELHNSNGDPEHHKSLAASYTEKANQAHEDDFSNSMNHVNAAYAHNKFAKFIKTGKFDNSDNKGRGT